MSARGGSVRTRAPLGSRGFEIPLVRVVLEPTPGLGRARGRCLSSPHAAARVLAPFVAQAAPTQRLAMALLDARERLLAVAVLDGAQWSACCLRPADAYEPALVAGASSVYLAHGHPSNKPWAGRADASSADDIARMGRELGLRVLDHFIFDTAGRYASLFAAYDTWTGWVRESLMHRWPLPVSGTCADRQAPATIATIAPRGASLHGPRFALSGLRARLDYEESPLRVERRFVAHTHADVAHLLRDSLDPHPRALALALLDRARRTFAVALIDPDGTGCACKTVSAEVVYRTVIACGAHAFFLAHHHARREKNAPDPACHATARLYAFGLELGLELRDHLLFARHGGNGHGGTRYTSLRAAGRGPEHWGAGDDLTATPHHLRIHQAGCNRRHQRPALTRSRSARAALQTCVACERRSANKTACPWCGAPRLVFVTQIDNVPDQAA